MEKLGTQLEAITKYTVIARPPVRADLTIHITYTALFLPGCRDVILSVYVPVQCTVYNIVCTVCSVHCPQIIYFSGG